MIRVGVISRFHKFMYSDTPPPPDWSVSPFYQAKSNVIAWFGLKVLSEKFSLI